MDSTGNQATMYYGKSFTTAGTLTWRGRGETEWEEVSNGKPPLGSGRTSKSTMRRLMARTTIVKGPSMYTTEQPAHGCLCVGACRVNIH